MSKKATKKAVKKDTKPTKTRTKKAQPVEVQYVTVPADLPLSPIEMAAAFNVPADNPLRKAYAQKIDEEISIASSLLQGKADNHGKLAESVGWYNALQFIKAEVEEAHSTAQATITANATMEQPVKRSSGY